jgi:hypothetical protein
MKNCPSKLAPVGLLLLAFIASAQENPVTLCAARPQPKETGCHWTYSAKLCVLDCTSTPVSRNEPPPKASPKSGPSSPGASAHAEPGSKADLDDIPAAKKAKLAKKEKPPRRVDESPATKK